MPKLKDVLRNTNNHWLEDVLDKTEVIIRNEKDSEQDYNTGPVPYFRPSSCHQCPRALWYKRMGYEATPPKTQSMRRMAAGTLYHSLMDERMKKSGVLVSSEERVELVDPPVVGHYDAIIADPKTGEQELLEIKSYAEPKLNSRFVLKLPLASHVSQWNLYSLMTGVAKGLIFYINKNDQSYKVCLQVQNSRLLSLLFRKLKWVDDAIKNGERIPYQPDEKHDWCDYKNICQKEWFIEGV